MPHARATRHTELPAIAGHVRDRVGAAAPDLVTLLADAGTVRMVDDAMADKYGIPPSCETYRLAADPAYRVWQFAPTLALAWWDPSADSTCRRWTWDRVPEPA